MNSWQKHAQPGNKKMEKTTPMTTTTSPETKRPSHVKNWGIQILKILVSAGLIYWLLRGTELAAIWQAIQGASLWLLLLAFSLHLGGFIISSYRWQLLLRVRHTQASIPFLLKSYMVAVFFNNFLPSTIGGDAYRAYDSWRLGQTKSDSVAIVFVDRFLGLFSLALFALLSAFIGNELTESIGSLYLWLALGAIGMLGMIWIMFVPSPRLVKLIQTIQFPLWRKVKILVEAFLAFQGEQKALVKALVLSMLLQVNVIIHYYLIALALGLSLPFYSFFLIIPLATVIMMVPISVNAIGIRENVFAFFFAPFGILVPQAIAFAWLAYGMVLIQGVLGGIVYGLRR
jgi:glycosyltransferase 2 family protein